MSIAVEVRLWGRRIGAAAMADGKRVARFEYDPEFATSGIEVSPIHMPLGLGGYEFPGLSRESFQGLPGMLADSLPDKFGNAVIDTWLARQGRERESFSALERLCYIGRRGMGALEYRPIRGPKETVETPIEISQMVALASEILSGRERLRGNFGSGDRDKAMRDILRVGTSAGGARAKALIAWNEASGEVRSGQVEAGEGFGYWLIKFDGVSQNRDKELEDPKGFGKIEYAYYLMARAAGIEMSECRLMKEGGRDHFMTRRFDRTEQGEKLHMQTLAALGHLDFNRAGAYGYELAFDIMKRMGLPKRDLEALYRRMCFNIVARNQDDHVKNIAYLMNKRGEWRLAPAYDMTYSYNPSGEWTSRHQMTLNGKRDQFTIRDFRAAAQVGGLKMNREKAILEEVESAVEKWMEYAEQAGVSEEAAKKIGAVHRLGLKQSR